MIVYLTNAAQVCINGHLVNASVIENPGECSAFCKICGAPTIKACNHCHKPIKLSQYNNGKDEALPPNFCTSCGSFFPWGKQK